MFAERCIEGIEAHTNRCAAMIEQSLALATKLVPVLGYDRTAQLVKEAYESGKTIRHIAQEQAVLPEQELNRVLGVLKK